MSNLKKITNHGGAIRWESQSIMKRRIERVVRNFHTSITRGESRYIDGMNMELLMKEMNETENIESLTTWVKKAVYLNKWIQSYEEYIRKNITKEETKIEDLLDTTLLFRNIIDSLSPEQKNKMKMLLEKYQDSEYIPHPNEWNGILSTGVLESVLEKQNLKLNKFKTQMKRLSDLKKTLIFVQRQRKSLQPYIYRNINYTTAFSEILQDNEENYESESESESDYDSDFS